MATIVDAVHEGLAFAREIVKLRKERLAADAWRKRYERAVQAAKQERAKRLAERITREMNDYIRRNRP